MAGEQNRQALEKIDSSLFVLCLDDHEPTTAQDVSYTFLHNHGNNRYVSVSVCVGCVLQD